MHTCDNPELIHIANSNWSENYKILIKYLSGQSPPQVDSVSEPENQQEFSISKNQLSYTQESGDRCLNAYIRLNTYGQNNITAYLPASTASSSCHSGWCQHSHALATLESKFECEVIGLSVGPPDVGGWERECNGYHLNSCLIDFWFQHTNIVNLGISLLQFI